MGAMGCRILGEEWNQNFLLVQWRHFLSKDSVCVFQLRLFVFIVCYIALLSHVVLLYSEITLLLLFMLVSLRLYLFLSFIYFILFSNTIQPPRWILYMWILHFLTNLTNLIHGDGRSVPFITYIDSLHICMLENYYFSSFLKPRFKDNVRKKEKRLL